MNEDDAARTPGLDAGSGRLEFFSDAIMAIAITLLVIEIKVPTTPGVKLAASLRLLWPAYVAYFLSFTTIGLVWIAHHSMFRRVGSVSRSLLLLNLLLMSSVVLLPFSTGVLSNYAWGDAESASVAALLYSINMTIIGLIFLGLWLYLSRQLHLLNGDNKRAFVRAAIKRSLIPPVGYGLSCGAAFVDTKICFVIWVLTTLYIVIGPALSQRSTPVPASVRGTHSSPEPVADD